MIGTGTFRTMMAGFAAAYLVLAAGSAAAVPHMASTAEAFGMLEGWDVPGAVKLVDAILEIDPGNADAAYVKARALFYDGNYTAARTRLEEWKPGVFFPDDPELRRLVDDTIAVTKGLRAYSGDHFILYASEDEDWVLIDGALRALEGGFQNLGRILGHYPDRPVRVEIIPDADEFRKVSSLSRRDIENSNAIGICKFNKIMILSPRLLVRGYRWMDTLAHEYVHYLLVRLTRNKAPIWVQEGMAKYYEKRWRPIRTEESTWLAGEAVLAVALEDDRLIPFESMDPSLVKLNSPTEVALAFAECVTAVEFIISKAGHEGLITFLKNIGAMDRGETRAALEQVIGLDFETFESDWKEFVSGRKPPAARHLYVERYMLADGHETEEDLFSAIQSQAARHHLSLGDALRKKGRHKPAMIEYKRAHREYPGSPYILDKIAIAAGLLGDYGALFEYAQQSREIAPDYPLTYMIMGNACLAQGRFGEAVRWYDEYNEINPFNPEVYFKKGAASGRAGRVEAALASWEISLKLDPSNGGLRKRIEAARKNLPTSGG